MTVPQYQKMEANKAQKEEILWRQQLHQGHKLRVRVAMEQEEMVPGLKLLVMVVAAQMPKWNRIRMVRL